MNASNTLQQRLGSNNAEQSVELNGILTEIEKILENPQKKKNSKATTKRIMKRKVSKIRQEVSVVFQFRYRFRQRLSERSNSQYFEAAEFVPVEE